MMHHMWVRVLVVCLAFNGFVLPSSWAASVGFHQLHYSEYDQKISVVDRVLDVHLSPTDDDDISLHAGVDGVSGATQAWQAKSSLRSVSGLAEINQEADSNVYGYDVSGYEVQRVKVKDEHRYSLGGTWLHRTSAGQEWTLGADYSREPDYISRALSAGVLHYLDGSKNTAIELQANALYDSVQVFDEYYWRSWDTKQSYNGQLGLKRVLSQRSLLNVALFGFMDKGYLSNHYGTVVRSFDADNDGVLETYLSADHRPSQRMGGGWSALWMVHWRDDWATHVGYRWYQDDWGVGSHTLDAKVFWNANHALTVGAGARYYHQSAANFYRDDTFSIKGFASSDHRLGRYHANTEFVNVLYRINSDWSIDTELGFMSQNTGLDALFWSFGLSWHND